MSSLFQPNRTPAIREARQKEVRPIEGIVPRYLYLVCPRPWPADMVHQPSSTEFPRKVLYDSFICYPGLRPVNIRAQGFIEGASVVDRALQRSVAVPLAGACSMKVTPLIAEDIKTLTCTKMTSMSQNRLHQSQLISSDSKPT